MFPVPPAAVAVAEPLLAPQVASTTEIIAISSTGSTITTELKV